MKIIKTLLAVSAIAIGACCMAQNNTMTPYSRYGYGMLSDNATSAQRAMGGVGYAMNSGRQINVMNPASYAAIDSLTFLFDMGVNINQLWANEGNHNERNTSGGLDYITMSFPITKWMGASAGLLPYSSTGYAFRQTIDNGSVSRTGNGNINQLYAGLGIEPFHNFYIGANVAYMFGTTINDVYAYTITSSTSLFERFIKVDDWRVDIGAQYSIDINPDNRVTLGVAYSPSKNLHGKTYGVYYDASASAAPDTVGLTTLNGKYSLPPSYGAGLSYSCNRKLLVEADFTYQPWKDAKFAPIENFEITNFDNRWKAALGLQYTPHLRGSYWQRAQYRAGVSYCNDYLSIKGNGLREWNAAVGIGLPVPGYKTLVNLTFEYKHRQASPSPLIKEQYLNVSIGVNFDEMWFRKFKIY